MIASRLDIDGRFFVSTRIAHPVEASNFVRCDGLVDTGASITLASRQVLDRLGPSDPVTYSMIRWSSGRSDFVPIFAAGVSFEPSEAIADWPYFGRQLGIGQMPDGLALDVILGVDFLRLFKVVIDGSSLVVTGPAGSHTPWAI